jgi:ABC-type polysaccharide/polyol phosphate export permease
MLRNIWRVRELLLTLVRRDLIVRYQSSVLGFLWSFANPLALVLIFYVAFSKILTFGAGHMPGSDISFGLHLLVGILSWSFFARCVSEGHGAILGHANLIKKIKMPIEVFPAVTVVGNLVNYLLGMLVVFPLLLLMLPADHVSLLQIPVQIFLFLLLTLLLSFLIFAITLFVSAVNVFYRDVQSLSEVGLLAWFYATPIIYPANLVTDKVQSGDLPRWTEVLYWLNPMTPIVVGYRRVLLYQPPHLEVPDSHLLTYLGLSMITIYILTLISQATFRHYARLFADEV